MFCQGLSYRFEASKLRVDGNESVAIYSAQRYGNEEWLWGSFDSRLEFVQLLLVSRDKWLLRAIAFPMMMGYSRLLPDGIIEIRSADQSTLTLQNKILHCLGIRIYMERETQVRYFFSNQILMP